MSRPLLVLILTLAVLTGAVANLSYVLGEEYTQLRGYENPLSGADMPFRVSRLGVNADLLQYDSERLARSLKSMHESHVHWIRQEVSWALTEPDPGSYRWNEWDRVFHELARYPDMQLIPVFVRAPKWARARVAPNVTAPPDDPADLARFASAFAKRYGDSLTYYQVWDEPNLASAWGDGEPRPARYAALLASCYVAIHAADPDAQVIAAALAPTTETGPRNVSDLQYLEALYDLGTADYMDAVAAKPYGFNRSALDRKTDEDILSFSRVVLLREIMVRNGDAQKMLWASSFGWNTLPDGWSGRPSIWGSVSHEFRVTNTLSALQRAEAEWPWMGGLILQHWQPVAPPEDPAWGFALNNQSGGTDDLLTALRSLPSSKVATNGLFPATNQSAQFSGVWTFGLLGADIGWVQDSQLSFEFEGSDVALLARQGDYVAYLYVTIDEAPANALPRDINGNSYLVLTSDTRKLETALITLARNLGPGKHQLHLVADRGWDHWALAGFAVSAGDLAEPYTRIHVVSELVVVVALTSFLVSLTQMNWRWLWSRFEVILRPMSTAVAIILSFVTSLLVMLGMLLSFGGGTPDILRRDPMPAVLAIVTSGLIRLQPGFLIVVVGTIVLLIIFYHRPQLGVGLTLFWSPFYLFPVELYRFAIPTAEILILITVAASLTKWLVLWSTAKRRTESRSTVKRSDFGLELTGFDWLVGAYLALGLVALSWSSLAASAHTEFRTLFLEPVALYFVIRVSRLKTSELLLALGGLLAGGLAIAIIGLLQFAQGQAIITAEEGARRLASVYGSPNNAGLFLERCVPFLVAFVIVVPDRRAKIAGFITLIPTTLALALTQSAGAIFIGLPAGLSVVLLLHLRRRAFLPLAILSMVGLVTLAFLSQSPRFAREFDLTEGTNFFRLRVWSSAANMISDHPLTGLGLDQFLYAFRGRYIQPDAWQEPDLSHPHNILLDFWIRLGITGTLLLLLMQWAFWRQVRLGLRFVPQSTTNRAVLIGTAGSMSGLLAHGMIDNSVFVVDLALVFFFLLTLAVQDFRFAGPQQSEFLPTPRAAALNSSSPEY